MTIPILKIKEDKELQLVVEFAINHFNKGVPSQSVEFPRRFTVIIIAYERSYRRSSSSEERENSIRTWWRLPFWSRNCSISPKEEVISKHASKVLTKLEVKETLHGSSDGSRTRRKSGRDDCKRRKDYQETRSNGWDSDWGPLSSAHTEEKYVPVTIKLKESPEFMNREEGEEGFYDVRDMQPVARLRKAWTEYPAEDEMQVDYEADPSVPRPPPKGSGPGKWLMEIGCMRKDLHSRQRRSSHHRLLLHHLNHHPTCAKRR
eukprot:4801690-Amphidinium_carterae.2